MGFDFGREVMNIDRNTGESVYDEEPIAQSDLDFEIARQLRKTRFAPEEYLSISQASKQAQERADRLYSVMQHSLADFHQAQTEANAMALAWAVYRVSQEANRDEAEYAIRHE